RAPGAVPRGRIPAGPGRLLGLLVEVVLLDVRQDEAGPADAVAEDFLAAGRQRLIRVVVVVHGQAELLEVVLALDAGGGLAHLLHRRQQEPDQDGNDGDYHQQLDEGESTTR